MELESSIGFLEQTMSNIIIRALTSLDDLKDRLKHPRLSIRQTALMYVSLFFKAWDPNAPIDIQHRQKERLKVGGGACPCRCHTSLCCRGRMRLTCTCYLALVTTGFRRGMPAV